MTSRNLYLQNGKGKTWGLAILLGLSLLGGCASQTSQINVDEVKTQAREYKESGAYDRDLAAAAAKAKAYILSRADQVSRPAIVLDIDETSLSNWTQIELNDFGRIQKGPCTLDPKEACGNDAWKALAQGTAIKPTLDMFNAAKEKKIAIFFISGRRESKRAATELNLKVAGYSGWTGLILKPPKIDFESAEDFKAVERAKIAAQGYTIIANIGDQPSDLAGGYAEQTFLFPNPFYRIE